ncbi:MAG: hypothetical protein ABSG41_08770 [Bryobacteraceae bacterium]|jgi:hypothetical protein
MRSFVTLAALLALSIAVVHAKNRDRIWKTGKVLDSQTAKTFVQTGSSTQTNGTATTNGTVSATTFGGSTTGTYGGTTTAHEASETQIHSMAIQDTQLLIVADDFLYIVDDTVLKGIGLNGSLARAIANRKHGCHVIIGDPVQYAQDKAILYLKDVDGKECKMEIMRQERVK